jgi:hypothetical protein
MALPDDVRGAAARVAAAARQVTIDDDALTAYVTTLGDTPPTELERDAAASLQLNAVNFGSGWFPTLRKRPGMSGFRTVEAGLRDHGPWPCAELADLTPRQVAEVLGQDPGHPLMAQFAAALRELGGHVGERHGGSFDAVVAAHADAVSLAEELAGLPMWRDVSVYDGAEVPFFKRAQIAAAALLVAGRERLTIFADNLVPHVLRIDGVLRFDPALVARIDAGELLEHGSPEEVEIRACAVEAVERLVAAHGATTASDVDWLLWNRGAGPRYKAHPRHRARTTAY